MKRVGFVGAAAVVLVLQGCGGYACDSSAHPGLIVRVRNASGGAVCDASVTATDGHYSEVLQAGGTAHDCTYVGALERRGTYTVTADRRGSTGTVPGVKVRSAKCHVITAEVTVKLGA